MTLTLSAVWCEQLFSFLDNICCHIINRTGSSFKTIHSPRTHAFQIGTLHKPLQNINERTYIQKMRLYGFVKNNKR